ncbi:MAG: LamB/YcsF family protein, partial [Chitinophagaceae bacterium]|nr:LamB/YcsF family protein [Chitinophagaceae bacterium]
YNMAAKDQQLARTIAQAVNDFDSSLILFGLSGSHLIREAKSLGLKTANEVFADRTYQDDGTLTPRTQPSALIGDANKSVQQVLLMVNKGKVITISGKEISIVAETICIHSDTKNAVELAKKLHQELTLG